MKFVGLLIVTSCYVGFAVGGGNTMADFEYVDEIISETERPKNLRTLMLNGPGESVPFDDLRLSRGPLFETSFEPSSSPSLEPMSETFDRFPTYIAPTSSPFVPEKDGGPGLPLSGDPNNVNTLSTTRSVDMAWKPFPPTITLLPFLAPWETRGPFWGPICTWGFFGKLGNPTNKNGNCYSPCGSFERKVRYRINKKFLFFGGQYVCCCEPY